MMLARLWVPAILLASSAASAQTAEQAIARTRALLADPCKQDLTDEIVVCGSRSQGDVYRVPITEDEGAIFDTRARRGEVPNASPDRLNAKGCGIFEGERRCGRKEMELYGYLRGRDPFSVLSKLVAIIADPDSDIAPPPKPR